LAWAFSLASVSRPRPILTIFTDRKHGSQRKYGIRKNVAACDTRCVMVGVRPSASGPAVRAHRAKFTVHSAKTAPAELREAAMAAISPALRKQIREASLLEWQPADVFMGLCEALGARGDDFARAFWRHSLHASISQPLINVLVSGGTVFYGRSPEALYRRTPRAWNLVTRACGEMRVAEGNGDNELTVIADGMPLSCRTSQALLRLWEGGFAGQADFVGHKVSVETDTQDFAAIGRVKFKLRWWSK
jgi:hypothetical protein